MAMDEVCNQVQGRCLCGDVQYAVQGDPIYNVVCHCENCRLATGSQFNAACIFKKTQFNIISDKSLKEYKDHHTDSGTPLSRFFCSNCGSSCFATTPLINDIVSVFSGTLENATSWKPMKEQFIATKSHWLPDFGIPECFDRNPSLSIA